MCDTSKWEGKFVNDMTYGKVCPKWFLPPGSSSSMKTVLLVFAHWERKSYNAAIKERTVEVLARLGHNVIVSDLYEMNFNPVLSQEDIVGKG